MSSEAFFLALVAAVAFERLVELGISRRNEARALDLGGIEAGSRHYPWMVALHLLFLIACPLEVVVAKREFSAPLGWAMGALLVLAMGLRYWTVSTLGERWTTRVFWVPGRKLATGGPFRFVRHPNYLAVVAEIFALPLIHGAWWTALVFSAANAVVLAFRIRAEEALLEIQAEYRDRLGTRPRFLPGSLR